ncbi:MAG: metallopeptidase family protein [Chloroflexi bacterium]|nr:metallopeptidase family protein [Chloroflexota bacterium]MDA1002750.1 metallopeptidase family protein [Chloroflexota bacterium]
MVVDALAALPEAFRERIDNLDIGVEDRPSVEDALRTRGTLLGIYRGVPLTVRGSGYGLTLPDRIVVFQASLEALATDEEHLRVLVRRTVLHEIAHHFGISDARLREIDAY